MEQEATHGVCGVVQVSVNNGKTGDDNNETKSGKSKTEELDGDGFGSARDRQRRTQSVVRHKQMRPNKRTIRQTARKTCCVTDSLRSPLFHPLLFASMHLCRPTDLRCVHEYFIGRCDERYKRNGNTMFMNEQRSN